MAGPGREDMVGRANVDSDRSEDWEDSPELMLLREEMNDELETGAKDLETEPWENGFHEGSRVNLMFSGNLGSVPFLELDDSILGALGSCRSGTSAPRCPHNPARKSRVESTLGRDGETRGRTDAVRRTPQSTAPDSSLPSWLHGTEVCVEGSLEEGMDDGGSFGVDRLSKKPVQISRILKGWRSKLWL